MDLGYFVGTAVMNPVSGTYRYGPGGASLAGALGFLADRKETDELYMVVDEELKMMSRVCDGGGHALDSSIMIRTADISASGQIKIGVGATLVRRSDPASEVAETRAKVSGLLAGLRTEAPVRFADLPVEC